MRRGTHRQEEEESGRHHGGEGETRLAAGHHDLAGGGHGAGVEPTGGARGKLFYGPAGRRIPASDSFTPMKRAAPLPAVAVLAAASSFLGRRPGSAPARLPRGTTSSWHAAAAELRLAPAEAPSSLPERRKED